jgi:mycobactin lysine-N-oxygenase
VERVAFDHVVVAVGFDALWWDAMLRPGAREALAAYLGAGAPGDGAGRLDGAAVERGVEADLGLAGVTPRLHLPLLAGLRQGPGFPNLSCLGLLADRVLGGAERPRDGVAFAVRATG